MATIQWWDLRDSTYTKWSELISSWDNPIPRAFWNALRTEHCLYGMPANIVQLKSNYVIRQN